MNARTFCLAVLTAFSPALIHGADSPTQPAPTNTSIATKLADVALLAGSPTNLTGLSESALNSPDTFNRILGGLQNYIVGANADTNSYLQLIKDFNLNFKVFNADSARGQAALGFDYSYDRSVAGRTLRPDSANPLGLSFALHAKGNVAFDKKRNPDDFLETGGKFHIFQSIGGWEPMINQKLVRKAGTTNDITEAQVLIDNLIGKLDFAEEQRKTNQEWQAFLNFIDQHSRLQFFWDAAGNIALESNQSFSKKQLAYGFQLGALVRAWNPSSPWARWNIFDFPFAAFRFAVGTDQEWSPSGQAYPSVVAGLDLVDPLNDTDRFDVDPNKDPYPRVRAEIAFKTRFIRLKDTDLWISLSYRHFQELGASSAIRRSGLDQTDYFAATFDLRYGFNFTYAAGRLPLDRASDSVFALGWKLNF